MAQDVHAQLRGEVTDRLRECVAALHGLGIRFAAGAGVHPTDLQALDLLARRDDAPMTVGELGGALELSSGAVTGLVDRLVAAGRVERLTDPADRRRVRLRLTRSAHELAGQVFGTYARRLDEAMAELDAAELRMVAAFLASASRAADLST